MEDRHPDIRVLVRKGKIDDKLDERLKRHITHYKEAFLEQKELHQAGMGTKPAESDEGAAAPADAAQDK
jgi:hypothetical protein